MRIQFWLWAVLLVFTVSCVSPSRKFGLQKRPLSSLSEQEEQYFQELFSQAMKKKLHQERFWHLLLHYNPKGSGYESEQDAESFFLSPDGKTSPKNELKYTLKSFFDHPYPPDQHPQCIFVARYHWLNSKLGFNPEYIPVRPCAKYNQWYENLTPTGISLIFPSYDLSSPGSMFGHTLLVLRSEENRITPLLDAAINFGAASPPEDSPFEFMMKGLLGGYPGVFGRHPYYFKIQEYVNQELRDLWEYKLNITKEGLRNIQRHVWELDYAFFDYYFFRENCAYYLLSLIEIGDPSLHLREDYSLKTLPADTIRQLLDIDYLIQERKYFPSRANKVKQKLDKLSVASREHFYSVIESSPYRLPKTFESLPLKEKALLLEAITEYLVIIKTPASKRFRMNLLKQRSQLDIAAQSIEYRVITSPPETGHKTTRIGIAVGGDNKDRSFVEIEGRGVFQGLLDNDKAYLPYKQIEIGRGKLRYYPSTGQVLVEEINIANTISLDYTSPFKPNPGTWKAEITFKQDRASKNCTDEDSCLSLQLSAGYGLAKKLGGGVFYGMVDTNINFGDVYDDNYQAAFGGDIGTLLRFGYDLKAFLSFKYSNFFLGQKDEYSSGKVGIRYQTSVNSEVRAEYIKVKDYFESSIAIKIHL